MQEPQEVGRADSTIPRFLFYEGLMRLLTAVRGWQENFYKNEKVFVLLGLYLFPYLCM